MRLERKFEILLIFCFALFASWLMFKSFSYDATLGQFIISRHQVGDFGLHLSLVRSFSWGSNFPPELPFFPGKPLPYHYFFDLAVGGLEKIGIRIDIAMNGLSVIFYTALLYLIYKISQIIIKKDRLIGILSVFLFVFHSNLSFIDFFMTNKLSINLFKNLWLLPDYLHKGPFDGSIISIFFTPNVLLNQRHLITGLALSLLVLYILLPRLKNSSQLSQKYLIMLGVLVGGLSRIHSLIFLSTVLVLLILIILFKRYKWILPLILPASIIASFHFLNIFNQELTLLFNPGFLSEKPFSLYNFLYYWFMNLGVAVFLIPLGVYKSSNFQRKVFLSFFVLFVVANSFQLSYRIDHNHSLINYFIIVGNMYIAYFLTTLWHKKARDKIVVCFLLFFLSFSGMLSMMAIKNDFRLPVKDAPSSKFIQWIRDNTDKNAIFLSKQEILDPVTLAGRRNYFGSTYYLSVMGYDYAKRSERVKEFFEANEKNTIKQIKIVGIQYIVVPKGTRVDFDYQINSIFLDKELTKVYTDEDFVVYKL